VDGSVAPRHKKQSRKRVGINFNEMLESAGKVIWLGQRQLPSRLIPHRHCPRPELQAAHEPQVNMLR
jgi:hypothetical protein